MYAQAMGEAMGKAMGEAMGEAQLPSASDESSCVSSPVLAQEVNAHSSAADAPTANAAAADAKDAPSSPKRSRSHLLVAKSPPFTRLPRLVRYTLLSAVLMRCHTWLHHSYPH